MVQCFPISLKRESEVLYNLKSFSSCLPLLPHLPLSPFVYHYLNLFSLKHSRASSHLRDLELVLSGTFFFQNTLRDLFLLVQVCAQMLFPQKGPPYSPKSPLPLLYLSSKHLWLLTIISYIYVYFFPPLEGKLHKAKTSFVFQCLKQCLEHSIQISINICWLNEWMTQKIKGPFISRSERCQILKLNFLSFWLSERKPLWKNSTQ